MARIIEEEELQREAAQRTVRCSPTLGGCGRWIRYTRGEVTTDKPGDRRFIVCPGCGYERVLAIGGIRDAG